ncbi:acetyl-CoA carboxylase biotin carboxyl carrier protein [bacterium M00.F.Ca.ET.228.01.1.1]|uniref:acetyl-CoA carboxylase biotin carboxyl carrier protein n=1 Tax=Paraburkholderia phenoliruptrix TaxID=252970 RepID=UPI001091F410|nr:acetyl-CoA carboxylase biotin carboxyl carrier protein [Paraburkholderia phenoliruptrix]TGP41507.1 acetyl-CoA carboxylase biotin carboxyl carrier protein [bacterium M00.F.Ca.ET.228.01.1.1]TGR98165.1 acetyl-CoA carboxylase biotin carboxyl carrier protein [bacterium M00.F.Ca.ET.191.01.1.1]TGU02356.1 acetyl-CoA carboxylase biotin carboxyl carrier protein [bacterium M00.F.Ca.ET.155.01.1.1]MBW0447158.1 acetyl-CoA carboxylase biotin carboxyl carrier protein [Paraburkholderia phenoliruptrix]MBW910
MDIQKIAHLVELLSGSTLTELTLREGDSSLHLSRGHATRAPEADPEVAALRVAATASRQPQPVAATASAPNDAPAAPPPAVQEGHYVVTSPLVGTFYRASSPDVAPFVQVGDRIEAGHIVAVVEAMKLLNEIEAERSGEVIEIHVENGAFVEYGQPLFTIQ